MTKNTKRKIIFIIILSLIYIFMPQYTPVYLIR